MIQVYSNEGKFFPPRNGEMIMKKWKYTNVCDVYINNFIPPEPHNIFYQTLLKAFILTWRGIKWAVTFQAESELWKFGDYIWFFSTPPPPLPPDFCLAYGVHVYIWIISLSVQRNHFSLDYSFLLELWSLISVSNIYSDFAMLFNLI